MSKYIKEDIETMLIEHKEKEAQLTEIDLKMDEYQQRLDYAGTVYEDTENEVIENMQIAGQAYDSIHSNTNKISDKVSNTVMNYHKELNHINNPRGRDSKCRGGLAFLVACLPCLLLSFLPPFPGGEG